MKKILKSIYISIPFKGPIFSLLKKIWKPNERIYRHLHFTTPFNLKIDAQTQFKIYNGTFIENELFWEGLTGKWEKESVGLWIKLCRDASDIFDIGANNGIYALVAASLNKTAEIYAFEPHPVFFSQLERNVAINSFPIHCEQLAVSDESGEITIDDYEGKTDTIKVSSVRVDDFVTDKLKGESLLFKIDVETFEPHVIRGMLDTIKRYRPTLIIEVLNDEVAEELNELLKDFGYVYFNVNELGGIRQTPTIEKSDYYNYLICTEETAKKIQLMN